MQPVESDMKLLPPRRTQARMTTEVATQALLPPPTTAAMDLLLSPFGQTLHLLPPRLDLLTLTIPVTHTTRETAIPDHHSTVMTTTTTMEAATLTIETPEMQSAETLLGTTAGTLTMTNVETITTVLRPTRDGPPGTVMSPGTTDMMTDATRRILEDTTRVLVMTAGTSMTAMRATRSPDTDETTVITPQTPGMMVDEIVTGGEMSGMTTHRAPSLGHPQRMTAAFNPSTVSLVSFFLYLYLSVSLPPLSLLGCPSLLL